MLLVDCRYVAGPTGPGSMITFVTERVTESSMKKANCTKSWPSFTLLPSQWKTNLSRKSQWNRSWCTAGVRSASSFVAFLGSHPPRWLKDMCEKFLQRIPSILTRALRFRVFVCHRSLDEDLFSGWAGRKLSWGVVMRSQKHVATSRRPHHAWHEWNTVLKAEKRPSRSAAGSVAFT